MDEFCFLFLQFVCVTRNIQVNENEVLQKKD
jgi:hypothetical protein